MPKKFDSLEDKRAYERKLYAESKGTYKDKVIARKKKNQAKLRQFIWDYLKEHPCIDCGEANPIVLEFDHLHDKQYTIGNICHFNISLETLQEEIAKCEVRCVKCHRLKTADQLGWYKGIIK